VSLTDGIGSLGSADSWKYVLLGLGLRGVMEADAGLLNPPPRGAAGIDAEAAELV
jgi:hypothetical protein